MANALDLPVGNEQIRHHLLAALQNGRLAHSILLCAQKGCGAGFTARCLAADFLYPNQSDTLQAQAVFSQKSPELLLLKGSGVSGEIKIDDVRSVRRKIYDTSLSSTGRVVLIQDAQNLNQASANALLKVMEEPPENVLFLFTATSAASVLATVRSRCCIYQLAPVSLAKCIQFVQQKQPQAENVPLLSRAFGGRIGSVLKVFNDSAEKELFDAACALGAAVQRADEYAAISVLCRYEKERMKAKRLMEYFCSLCAGALHHDIAIIQAERAAHGIHEAYKVQQQLDKNVSVKLALTYFACCACTQ